jgi:hypothetical protein
MTCRSASIPAPVAAGAEHQAQLNLEAGNHGFPAFYFAGE